MTSLTSRNDLLARMYADGWVPGPDGDRVDVHSRLSPEHGEALYQLVLAEQPHRVIEVGMAFGASTLAILTALEELGGDRQLVSLDPLQSTLWRGVGVHNVARCGFADLHELVEETDYVGLPALLRQGRQFDFAYIDGWHTFDYTLLDFFYIDRMLHPGGIVGFNDCDLAAVTKVIDFVRTHRHYDRVDAALTPRYAAPPTRAAKVVWAVGRRLPLGPRPNPIQRAVGTRADDQYLRKREDWEPDWDFFAPF